MTTTGEHCQAVTKSGARCGAYALAGSRFCFTHDPAHSAQRKAARAAGGYARHGRKIGPVGEGEPVALATVGDIVRLIEQAVNDCLRLENSLARARTIGSLAAVAIQAIKTDELEQRFEAIEAALKLRTNEH